MEIKTYAFIAVAPNPIGIGQTANVTFGIDKPQDVQPTGPYGDRWTNYTVIITKPDGTVKTLQDSHQMIRDLHTPRNTPTNSATTLSS